MKHIFITFIILLIVHRKESVPLSGEDDDAIEWVTGCSMTVWAAQPGSNFVVTNKKIINCENGSIFWSYPQKNLTVKFSADLESSSTFNLCLVDTYYLDPRIPVYRVLDGNEIPIDTSKDSICLNSDSDNQVVLKLYGPSNGINSYGLFITYNIKINY